MTIFGRRFSDYVRFCKLFLVLIAGVGIFRLLLSLSGVPNETAKWFSITAVSWIGLFYHAVRIPATRFGSYKQLLVICFLQNAVAQIIAISAILVALLTGVDNIYSIPEYAFGGTNRWLHLGAHIVIGTPAGTLVLWLIGSLVLLATKKLMRSDSKIGSLAQ
jgi:hypothetical protein